MFDLVIWSVIVIVWALVERWPPVVLMWVCWGQGICSVLFIVLRLLFVRCGGDWDKYSRARSAHGIFAFLLFNLFFYILYIYFISKLFDKVNFDNSYIRMILIPTGLYFLSQLFWLIHRIVKGEEAIIDNSFFDRSLFGRLVPMHILIIGGGFLKNVIEAQMYGMGVLVFLLVLKFLSDTGTFVYSIKGFSR
jgi:hypothetical protein